MKRKTYSISPAKIGNQDGFRLPRLFSLEHPQLVKASGEVEVLDEQTLLVRLQPTEREEDTEEDGVMMTLFLEFLMKDAISHPDNLIPYAQEMSTKLDELLAGVEIDP